MRMEDEIREMIADDEVIIPGPVVSADHRNWNSPVLFFSYHHGRQATSFGLDEAFFQF